LVIQLLLLIAIATFVVILFEINLNGVLTRASVGLRHESELGKGGRFAVAPLIAIGCVLKRKFRIFLGKFGKMVPAYSAYLYWAFCSLWILFCDGFTGLFRLFFFREERYVFAAALCLCCVVVVPL